MTLIRITHAIRANREWHDCDSGTWTMIPIFISCEERCLPGPRSSTCFDCTAIETWPPLAVGLHGPIMTPVGMKWGPMRRVMDSHYFTFIPCTWVRINGCYTQAKKDLNHMITKGKRPYCLHTDRNRWDACNQLKYHTHPCLLSLMYSW